MKSISNKKTREINNIDELINFYKRNPNDTANIIKNMSNSDFLAIVTFSDEFQRAVNEMPNCADVLVQKALHSDEVFRMVTITPYMTYKLIDGIPANYANQLLDRLATDGKHFDRLYYDNGHGDVYDLLRTTAKLPDEVADKFVQRIFTDPKTYNLVFANIMPIIHEAYNLRPHLSDQLIEKVLDDENEFYRLMDGNEYTLRMLADHFPRYPVLQLKLDDVIPAWKAQKANKTSDNAGDHADLSSFLNNKPNSSYSNFNMFANMNHPRLEMNNSQTLSNNNLAEENEVIAASAYRGLSQ